jgi:hypothetical protein
MPLTEQEFTALVDGGCDGCNGKVMQIAAIVSRRVPLMGGELFGEPTWGYKGEELVRGTYQITCDRCKKRLYESDACQLCASAGGVQKALSTENDFTLLHKCPACESELLTVHAYVPAKVLYEGKRAAKARSNVGEYDTGFHGYLIHCKPCGFVEQRHSPCPLCASPSRG